MRLPLLLAAPGLLLAQPGRLIDPAKVVDLTHAYDESTVYWPGSPPFAWKREAWGKSQGYFYASGSFSTSEHGGTHIDSPIHFAEGRMSTAAIPVSRLVGAAAVIDVSVACARNPDYEVTPTDLRAWEARHRLLSPADIVMVRTGWGKRWPDKKAYLGSGRAGDTAGLRFPGLSAAAARLLVDRGVPGVGIDTASLDPGRSRDFMAHRTLSSADIYGLENVANLGRLPLSGATVVALPVKIQGGTGGPVRIIAILP